MKILEKISKIFQNKNIQSILCVLLGCYFIPVLFITIAFWGGTALTGTIIEWLIYSPLILFIGLMLFMPAFILIFFIFKNTNNTSLKILSFSFLIPFFNLVYFYIESYMSISMIYYSCVLGALWLFLILPSVFIITLCLPKKILQIKKQILLTTFLTFLLGWMLVGITFLTKISQNNSNAKQRTWFWNPIIMHQLDAYHPIINDIETHKKQNGKYPKNVSFNNVVSKSYPYYSYQTFNDNNDFILSVSQYKIENNCIFCYRFCSSQALPKCKAMGYKHGYTYWQLGKWVYESFDD